MRAFAELTLKVLSSGDGRNTSLLADKAAFFEFMDRVNERCDKLFAERNAFRVVNANIYVDMNA